MKHFININICVLASIFFLNGSSGQPMDICTFPKNAGSCKDMIISYFYNEETSRCESFFYGGCQGNENNFETLKECQDACHESSSLNPSVKSEHCKLEPQSGPIFCVEFIKKFTFNYESLQCESYIYSGCGGTENLFDSIPECMYSCVHGDVGGSVNLNPVDNNEPKEFVRPDFCSQPPAIQDETYQCFFFVDGFTFNHSKGICEDVVVEECNTTKNFFSNIEECIEVCEGPTN